MAKNKINTYTCPHGHVTVTRDIDDGVTPMVIRCRQKHDDGKHNCTEFAKSSWYNCDQTLIAEYEWFKPKSLKGYNPEMKEHLRKGGLDMRRASTITTKL